MNPFQQLHERWLAWQEKQKRLAEEREHARKQSAWAQRMERVREMQRELRRKEEATMRAVFPEDARDDDIEDAERRGVTNWRGKATRWR